MVQSSSTTTKFLTLTKFLTCAALISLATAQRCRPGSFRNGTICTLCPIGTFQISIEADECRPCPPGRVTLRPGAQTRRLCTPCPSNTFGGGQDPCILCPPGSTSSRGSSTIDRCLICGPGTRIARDGRDCEQCPEFTFSSDNSTSCTNCPDDAFSPEGSTSITQCATRTCPPGRRLTNGGRCEPCPQGTFKPDRMSRCESCPSGTDSEQGASECTPCPEGFASTFSFECDRCVRGTIALGVGSTICRRRNGPCPSDSIEAADGACVRCPSTQRVNLATGLCERCPEPLRAEAPDATECTRCPRGMRSSFGTCLCPPGTSQTDDDKCIPCEAGNENPFAGSLCDTCFGRRIAPRRGMRRCELCPTGTFASDDHTKCIPCPEGTTTGIGPPELFISDVTLLPIDECRQFETGCPIGFSLFPAGSPFANCIPTICRVNSPPGANCRSCTPGNEPNQFRRTTFPCDSCSFGMVSDGLKCRRCPRGMVSGLDAGVTKCVCGIGRGMIRGMCRDCPAGSASFLGSETCEKCDPGSFAPDGRSEGCSLCPIDTFSNRSGAEHCEMCPAGTFTYGEGSTECLEFLT